MTIRTFSLPMRRLCILLSSGLLLLALSLVFSGQVSAQADLPNNAQTATADKPKRQSLQLELTNASTTGEAPYLLLTAFTVETNGGVHVDTGVLLEQAGAVRSQLRDGAVMHLSCRVVLQRIRTLLSNEILSQCDREYLLRHDLLTREFILSSPGMPTVRQKHFSALLDTLKKLNFVLPIQEALQPGESYRVQVQFIFRHTEVPPWLEQALFFWSWDVTPPLSFSQDFVY